MDDDQQLLMRVLAGNAEAFRGLVERHQRVVWTFAWNMLRNDADTEDLVQEVFLAAFRHLADFDASRARFSTWLLTIARNRCLNALKQRRELPACEFEMADDGPEPGAATLDGEFWHTLDAALVRLPVVQRTAFILAEIQDLPYSEIAAIEGIELGTVKSRVSRGKARLRELLRHHFITQETHHE